MSNEVLEGNRAINIFMGLEWCPAESKDGNSRRSYRDYFKDYDACQMLCDEINKVYHKGKKVVTPHPVNESHFVIEPEYHSSWDALMPVVEKIGKMYDDKMLLNIKELSIFALGIFATIELTWQAVIQFINFYNQNKSK